MKLLLVSSAFFALAFAVHVFIWKVRRSLRHMDMIFVIFAAMLGIELFVSRYLASAGMVIFASPADYVRFCLFYISATLAYIISYSALEADSPTLMMILILDRAGSSGLSLAELEGSASNEFMILLRLNDLVRDGLVSCDKGRYSLKAKGLLFVNIFIFFKRLLGTPKGG
jgi:hypothetical protein